MSGNSSHEDIRRGRTLRSPAGQSPAPTNILMRESAGTAGSEPLLCGFARHRPRLSQLALPAHRLINWREGRARDVSAGAAHSVELAVGPDDLALADRVARPAGHGHPLEDVEVDLLVVRLCRGRTTPLGIPDDNIGIGAHPERALSPI